MTAEPPMLSIIRDERHTRSRELPGTLAEKRALLAERIQWSGGLGAGVDLRTYVTRKEGEGAQDFCVSYALAHVRSGVVEDERVDVEDFGRARFFHERISVDELLRRLEGLDLGALGGSSDVLGQLRCGTLTAKAIHRGDMTLRGPAHGANKFSSSPCWLWSVELSAPTVSGALAGIGSGASFYAREFELIAKRGGMRTLHPFDTFHFSLNVLVSDPRGTIVALEQDEDGRAVATLAGCELERYELRWLTGYEGENDEAPARERVVIYERYPYDSDRTFELVLVDPETAEVIDGALFVVKPDYYAELSAARARAAGVVLQPLTPAPLTVLFLSTGTGAGAAARFDEEQKAIMDASGGGDREIELIVKPAATVRELRRALLKQAFDVVHISGHGTEQGVVFSGDGVLPPKALAELFGRYTPPRGRLQCVVLNACATEDVAREIGATVSHAIAVTGELIDAGAIAYARGFYDALAMGSTFARAHEEGMSSMKLEAPQGISNIVHLASEPCDEPPELATVKA